MLDLDEKGKGVIRTFTGDAVNPNTGEVKKLEDGVFKFRSKDFGKWMDINLELKEFIYNMICDRVIMKYRVNHDFGIDDITIDDDFINEDD